MEVKVHAYLTWELYGGWWSASPIGPFNPRERVRINLLSMRLGRQHNQSGRYRP